MVCLWPLLSLAQVPDAINFQTVVRNQDGKPLENKELSVRISLLQGGENGNVVFSENHNTSTNVFGLANVLIGRGDNTTGNLLQINWSTGTYFLKVEIDPDGGSNYELTSIQPLLTVPYALYAEKTNLNPGTGISITNGTIQNTGDLSNTNEIQTLTLNGNILHLSSGGGSVPLPTGADNWGTQVVVSNPTLQGNGTQTSPLDIKDNAIESRHIHNGTIVLEDLAPGVIQTLNPGTGISITNGTIQNTGDLSNTNEIQTLTLNGNILNLSSGGGSVPLPTGADNWGTQVVVSNPTLQGNGTQTSPLDIKDNAIESRHIHNGTIVQEDLAPGVIQTLNPGTGISITNGTIQNTGDLSNTNEIQNLSYDANERKLSISNGNTIQFQALNLTKISDTDGNTFVETEKTLNDDKIRHNLSGEEYWVFQKNAGGNPMIQFTNHRGGLFIGQDAGLNNVTSSDISSGFGNSFVGHLSGVYNSTGNHNTGFGQYSLWGNKTGSQNVAVGFESLLLGEKGQANVSIGFRAMMNFLSGNRNIALGRYALGIIEGGNNNVAIGDNAQAYAKNRSYTISIGDSTLYWNGFGQSDLNKAIDNMAIGSKSMYSNTMGSENLAIGNQTLFNNISGDRNTTVGLASMFGNISGHSNTGLGYHALFANETGHSNVSIGTNSLSANFEGFGNVAIGSTAMFGNTDGNVNTAVGTGALFSNSSGSYNVAVGYNALSGNTLGINNVVMGPEAMFNNLNGVYNICMGSWTLYENTSGSQNTALGHLAGGLGPQNQNCTYLGNDSKNSSSTSYTNSTAIGANSRITASNQVRIGDANTTSIGGYRAWSNISDARFKQDVREDVRGLEFILKLRPVTYLLDMPALEKSLGISHQSEKAGLNMPKAPLSRQTGFIAQEVETVGKEIQYNFSGVDKPQNNQDFYGLRYAEFVVPLVKAVQEQQAIIDKQQKQIQDLINRIQVLEDKK